MGLAVAVGAATAISVTTVLESVAVVGAVVGAVGAVTGNKTLSMIGLGLGVVGGVGALATSALGVGSAAVTGATEAGAAAGTASEAAAGAAAGVGEASTTAMDVASAAINPATGLSLESSIGAAPDIFGDLAGVTSAATEAVNPAELLPGTLGSGSTADGGNLGLFTTNSTNPADAVAPGTTGTDTSTLASTSATNPTATAIPEPPVTPGNLGAVDPASGQVITSYVNPSGEMVGMPEAESSGTFSNILKFIRKNPTLSAGVVQAGGSLLSGMTSTLTPAQVNALNAQAAANNAAADLTKQRTENLAMPKAVASSAPVTGAPQQLVPGQPGLINQAPRPQVTGVAA